jgi:hypothetical protein
VSTPFVWECPYGVCAGDGFEVVERLYPLTSRDDPEQAMRERVARDCRCADARRATRQEWLRAQGTGRNGHLAGQAASEGGSW